MQIGTAEKLQRKYMSQRLSETIRFRRRFDEDHNDRDEVFSTRSSSAEF